MGKDTLTMDDIIRCVKSLDKISRNAPMTLGDLPQLKKGESPWLLTATKKKGKKAKKTIDRKRGA